MGAAVYPEHPVLLVDDEQQFLFSAENVLTTNGINNVVTLSDSTKVMDRLDKEEFSVVVLDINMPNISGLELLPMIVDKHPGIPVVIVTAMNDVESAVQSIKAGAFNYILKQ